MPELPEVETVRRGLQPVMEGARFVRVEARRPDLRFPFPKNFADRLEGQTVSGIGRRAKYLLADISSGEVLLMHLGMSGSFHVLHESDAATPGDFHYERGKLSAHDHVVFHMSNGAGGHLQRSAPLRLHEADRARRAEPASDDRGARPRAARQRLRRRDAGRGLRGQEDEPQGRAVGPEGRRGPRQHLCVRGAAPRASVAQAAGLDHRDAQPARRTPRAGALADAIKAVLNDAIRAGGSSLRDHRQTDGDLGYFQHSFRVYDRAGTKCPTPKCKGTIKRIVQGTRSTFFCPVCQK